VSFASRLFVAWAIVSVIGRAKSVPRPCGHVVDIGNVANGAYTDLKQLAQSPPADGAGVRTPHSKSLQSNAIEHYPESELNGNSPIHSREPGEIVHVWEGCLWIRCVKYASYIELGTRRLAFALMAVSPSDRIRWL
jgi:hypothetical protein